MSKATPTQKQKSGRSDISETTTPGDESRMIVQRLQETAAIVHLDLAGTVEDWQRDAVEDENRAAALDARRGLRLLAIKKELGHGKFTAWLESQGFAPQRTSELMRIAQMLMQAQHGTAAKLIGMEKSKLVTLAKLPIETIEDAEAKGELDEIDEMSVRELKAYAKKMETRAINAEHDKQALTEKNKKLIQEKDNRLPEKEFPKFVAIMRSEAFALSEKMLLCVDSMEQMLNDHITALTAGGHSQEWHDNASIASQTLFIHMQGAAARAVAVTQRMAEELGIDDNLRTTAIAMTDNELKQALDSRSILVRGHEQEATARAMLEAAKHRTAGRPVGSKNKTKGKDKK